MARIYLLRCLLLILECRRPHQSNPARLLCPRSRLGLSQQSFCRQLQTPECSRYKTDGSLQLLLSRVPDTVHAIRGLAQLALPLSPWGRASCQFQPDRPGTSHPVRWWLAYRIRHCVVPIQDLILLRRERNATWHWLIRLLLLHGLAHQIQAHRYQWCEHHWFLLAAAVKVRR